MKANVKNVLSDKSDGHTRFSQYWGNFILSKAYHILGAALEPAKNAWTQFIFVQYTIIRVFRGFVEGVAHAFEGYSH